MPLTSTTPLELLRPLAPGGFDGSAVPRETIEEILDIAARAPSGTNTQPWQVVVVSGATRQRVVHAAHALAEGLCTDAAQRAGFWQAFDAHAQAHGWSAQPQARGADPDLAEALARCEDAPAAALPALRHYFDFNAAPVGLFMLLHTDLGVGSVLDTGMFVQNIVLAAQERGLRAVLQTGWRGIGDSLREPLACPADHGVLCAVALGWDAPVAGTRAPSGVDVAGAMRWHA